MLLTDHTCTFQEENSDKVICVIFLFISDQQSLFWIYVQLAVMPPPPTHAQSYNKRNYGPVH